MRIAVKEIGSVVYGKLHYSQAAKFGVGDFLLPLPRVLRVTESTHTVMFYSSAMLSLRKFCLEFEILSQRFEFPHMCHTDSMCQGNNLCKSSSPHVNIHVLLAFHIQFLQTHFFFLNWKIIIGGLSTAIANHIIGAP